MAKTLFQLTEGNAPALTDYALTGQDPAGSPAMRRLTWATIRNLFIGAPAAINDFIISLDGSTWSKRTLAQTQAILGVDTYGSTIANGLIPCSGTHTYASATTITVPPGAEAIYSVGDKYKYTQARSQAFTNDPAAGSNIELNMTDTSGFNVGNIVTVSSSAGSEQARITVVHANTHITVDTLALNHTTTNPMVYIGKTTTGEKWAYIVGVADQLLTITSGSDYTLENATITTPYYSKGRAVGFPEWFNYKPTGISATNVTLSGRFNICGRLCTYEFNATFSGAITYTDFPSLPVTVGSNFLLATLGGGKTAVYYDISVGGINYTGLVASVRPSGTLMFLTSPTFTYMSATSPITWENGDMIEVQISYEI